MDEEKKDNVVPLLKRGPSEKPAEPEAENAAGSLLGGESAHDRHKRQEKERLRKAQEIARRLKAGTWSGPRG